MLPQAGDEFGPYRVFESIGHGAMGVVFRAVHRDLRRDVALKVLAPQFSADQTYRARFLSEAQTLARLESSHIVAIYDAGEHDGSLYLAMQLVPGGDLSGLLRSNGPMPLDKALDVLRQVASGLQVAHDAGVLHRDIKPSNVLLRRLEDGADRVYLCDFGIAQAGDSQHTRTGGVVGTWSYLAPERLRGAPASPASDLYAMGCLLWALVTGGPPFAGSSEMETALGHLQGPVPQLAASAGGPDQVAGVNHLLRRLMVKDPSYRLDTAAALSADIDRITTPTARAEALGAGGSSVSLDPPTDARSHRRGRASRRWIWMLAAAAVLVLVAGGMSAVVLSLGEENGSGRGSGPEFAYAGDDEAGVVDADYTTTECTEVGGGFRVGGIAPSTGVFQNQGDAVTAGIGLAVSDINAAGGVGDDEACHLVLDEDDRTADDLLDVGVSVVVGGVSTQLTEDVAWELDGSTTFITPGAFSAALYGSGGTSFRTIANTTAGADALLGLLAEDGRVSPAVVGTDTEPSSSTWQAVNDVIDLTTETCAFGCGTDDRFELATFDAPGIAAQIAATDADSVVITESETTTSLVAALEAVGWTGRYYFTYYPSGVNLEGLDASAYERMTGVFPAVTTPDGFRSRVEGWLTATGGGNLERAALSAESYDSTVLAALAAVRGGAVESATVTENLRAVSGDGGGTPCVTYRQCAELLEAGEEIVYQGVAVKAPFTELGELTEAYVSRVFWDADGSPQVQDEDQVVGLDLSEF